MGVQKTGRTPRFRLAVSRLLPPGSVRCLAHGSGRAHCVQVQPCILSEFSFFLKGEASSSQPRIQRHACAWPRLHSEGRRQKAAHGGSETGLLHVSASGLASLLLLWAGPWPSLVPESQDGTSPQRHPAQSTRNATRKKPWTIWPTVAVTWLHRCILPLSWTSAGRS